LAMFCQRVLTYSPMSGLSLSSRIRNTSAAGSSVTVTNATLGGSGAINGSGTVQSNGVLSAGNNGIGTLAINNTLTFLGGSTNKAEVTSTGSHDLVTGLTSVAYNGTLFATNLSGTLTNGQTFPIFSAAAHTGNFTNIVGAPGTGLVWAFNPTNGVLSVALGVNTNATNITYSLDATGTHLALSWPADHLGWSLEAQTNSLTVGILSGSTNWYKIAGTASVTSTNLAINPTNATVFFRMVYP